jgi:drug/metabolite transporter (DMT)-like permease
VVGAAVAAVLVWAVGELLLGYDMIIKAEGQEPQDLGASAIVMFSVFFSPLALLDRVPARARLIWTVVALVALAVSFFFPLFTIEALGGTKVAHVAVAAVLIPVFRATSTSKLQTEGASC